MTPPLPAYLFPQHALDRMFQVLKSLGYRIVGPREKDGVIDFAPLASLSQLPRGRTDEQGPGTYRLQPDDRGYLFHYTVGPASLRHFLQPSREKILTIPHSKDGMGRPVDAVASVPPTAFIGLRSCDLAALAIQDRVLNHGGSRNHAYASKRDGHLWIAVQCGKASSTCFCASMDTGPKARDGYDLALTEITLKDGIYFHVEVGSPDGEKILAGMQDVLIPVSVDGQSKAQDAWDQAVIQQTKPMPGKGQPQILAQSWDHSQWDDVASRCLSCANCTLVCPTCFCTTTEDVTDLTGDHAERWQTWDSCFHGAYSYMHGGQQRPSIRSRYRQWLTHKLSSWHQQFGSSGCVGCGRCVAWCPVGIDLRDEVAALTATPSVSPSQVQERT